MGTSNVLCRDYLQFLPVFPSRKYSEDGDWIGHYTLANFLGGPSRALILRQSVKKRTLSEQVRQSKYPQSSGLLNYVAKRTFTVNVLYRFGGQQTGMKHAKALFNDIQLGN